ncbi:MAG TPA: hypothetical protein VHW24_25995 [Bryobacteraceae bacterium]|nr:hypothetical protein [Bryobacteraceae bacterium]
MTMFTPETREQLRAALLDFARSDSRITGAAITGSAASDASDRWSDIDLAFGIAASADVTATLTDWTAHMYAQCRAVHHTDVRAGAWIYRVFLLADSLQVDLAFTPADQFRAIGPTFRLVYGKAEPPLEMPNAAPADLIGLGWLYALHARSAIARDKLWQAEYMVSGIRDHVMALACLRHGLATVHARGVDQLPGDVAAGFEAALVRNLTHAELSRAFRAALELLMREAALADPALAARLTTPLKLLTVTQLEAAM